MSFMVLQLNLKETFRQNEILFIALLLTLESPDTGWVELQTDLSR